LGRAEAEVLGYAGLPLIPVPHPLAGNKKELVAAKATGVLDEIVDALTGEAEAVAGRHRTRFTHLTQRRLEHGAVCIDEVCAVDVALLRGPT